MFLLGVHNAVYKCIYIPSLLGYIRALATICFIGFLMDDGNVFFKSGSFWNQFPSHANLACSSSC